MRSRRKRSKFRDLLYQIRKNFIYWLIGPVEGIEKNDDE